MRRMTAHVNIMAISVIAIVTATSGSNVNLTGPKVVKEVETVFSCTEIMGVIRYSNIECVEKTEVVVGEIILEAVSTLVTSSFNS